MSLSQEKELTFRERVSLRFHFIICEGCKNYNRQLDVIRKACKNLSK